LMLEELEKERGAHRRTAKGLEQLRIHFSKVPSAGEAGVRKDEITTWTYQ